MLLHKTPNRTKFCGDLVKNAGDIRDREFVLPEKVGQSSPKIFVGCYPLRPPIMPNFIEIGRTSLEIGVGRKTNFHTQTHMWQTDTRHPDWLSRASQHAIGETKSTLSVIGVVLNLWHFSVPKPWWRLRDNWICAPTNSLIYSWILQTQMCVTAAMQIPDVIWALSVTVVAHQWLCLTGKIWLPVSFLHLLSRWDCCRVISC